MKKLLAFVLVLGLATVANAAMLKFEAPAEVQLDETFTVNIVSDAALDYFVVSIAVDGAMADVGLGSVNAGFDAGVTNPGSKLDGSVGNVFIKKMVGQADATSPSVDAGIVGTFTITAAGVEGVITIDDFKGGGIGGPPVATKLIAGGETTITEIDIASIPVTVVPEPMTMSLLGLGGLALIRRRR